MGSTKYMKATIETTKMSDASTRPRVNTTRGISSSREPDLARSERVAGVIDSGALVWVSPSSAIDSYPAPARASIALTPADNSRAVGVTCGAMLDGPSRSGRGAREQIDRVVLAEIHDRDAEQPDV